MEGYGDPPRAECVWFSRESAATGFGLLGGGPGPQKLNRERFSPESLVVVDQEAERKKIDDLFGTLKEALDRKAEQPSDARAEPIPA